MKVTIVYITNIWNIVERKIRYKHCCRLSESCEGNWTSKSTVTSIHKKVQTSAEPISTNNKVRQCVAIKVTSRYSPGRIKPHDVNGLGKSTSRIQKKSKG